MMGVSRATRGASVRLSVNVSLAEDGETDEEEIVYLIRRRLQRKHRRITISVTVVTVV